MSLRKILSALLQYIQVSECRLGHRRDGCLFSAEGSSKKIVLKILEKKQDENA